MKESTTTLVKRILSLNLNNSDDVVFLFHQLTLYRNPSKEFGDKVLVQYAVNIRVFELQKRGLLR